MNLNFKRIFIASVFVLSFLAIGNVLAGENIPPFDGQNLGSIDCSNTSGGWDTCYIFVPVNNLKDYQAFAGIIDVLFDSYGSAPDSSVIIDICLTETRTWGTGQMAGCSEIYRTPQANRSNPPDVRINDGIRINDLGNYSWHLSYAGFRIQVDDGRVFGAGFAEGRRVHIYDVSPKQSTIANGQSTEICWDTKHVPDGSFRVLKDDSGNILNQGGQIDTCQQVNPTRTTTYTLYATGPAGYNGIELPPVTVQKSTTVTVGNQPTGTIRSDWQTCTKNTLTNNLNCDVVLNYTTNNATEGNIRKNGSAWYPIPPNTLPAGYTTDSNPIPGTYTYALYGSNDSFTESKFDEVTVTINPATGGGDEEPPPPPPPPSQTCQDPNATNFGGPLPCTYPSGSQFNDAQYISQRVPSQMTAGQSTSVSVTMKNIGTTTWTSAGGYKLGSQNPQDNFTWRLARDAVSRTVSPGQQETFDFNITAPSTPGTYNFQWRMVQEGVQWFGDFTLNVAVIVSSADVTTCQDPNASNFGGALPCTYPPPTTCQDPNASNFGGALPCTYPPPPTTCQDTSANNYGQPLPCTYTVNPQTNVTGYLDTVTCEVIRGWALDPDTKPNSVQVRVNSSYIGEIYNTNTDVMRTDVNSVYGSNGGRHGFNFSTPASVKDGRNHSIIAEGYDPNTKQWKQLNQSPKSLQCAPPEPPPGTCKGKVKVETNQDSAIYTITKPNNTTFSDAGDETYNNMDCGTYVIQPSSLSGYTVQVQPNSSQPLNTNNGTITFDVRYSAVPNDPDPQQLNITAQDVCTVDVQNPAPNNPGNVTVTEPNYCVSGPGGTIAWSYSDPLGSPQSAYQVQVDDQGGFNSPEVDSGKINSGSTAYSIPAGRLGFNITYRARVKVWNSSDFASDWTTSSTWKTPSHAYPNANPPYQFTWTPATPAPTVPVQFTDRAWFDGSSNNKQWRWTASNGQTSTQQNPQFTFSSVGNYQVTEEVRDNAVPSGQYCQGQTQTINVKKPVPTIKEVPPK